MVLTNTLAAFLLMGNAVSTDTETLSQKPNKYVFVQKNPMEFEIPGGYKTIYDIKSTDTVLLKNINSHSLKRIKELEKKSSVLSKKLLGDYYASACFSSLYLNDSKMAEQLTEELFSYSEKNLESNIYIKSNLLNLWSMVWRICKVSLDNNNYDTVIKWREKLISLYDKVRVADSSDDITFFRFSAYWEYVKFLSTNMDNADNYNKICELYEKTITCATFIDYSDIIISKRALEHRQEVIFSYFDYLEKYGNTDQINNLITQVDADIKDKNGFGYLSGLYLKLKEREIDYIAYKSSIEAANEKIQFIINTTNFSNLSREQTFSYINLINKQAYYSLLCMNEVKFKSSLKHIESINATEKLIPRQILLNIVGHLKFVQAYYAKDFQSFNKYLEELSAEYSKFPMHPNLQGELPAQLMFDLGILYVNFIILGYIESNSRLLFERQIINKILKKFPDNQKFVFIENQINLQLEMMTTSSTKESQKNAADKLLTTPVHKNNIDNSLIFLRAAYLTDNSKMISELEMNLKKCGVSSTIIESIQEVYIPKNK